MKEEEVVYQDRTSLSEAGVLSRIFFKWVIPVIDYTKKNKKLKVEHYGNLREKDKAKSHIKRLQSIWEGMKQKEKVTDYTLIRAVFSAFKKEYCLMIILNSLQSCFQMATPFVMMPLVQYIKTGENAWGVEYLDTKDTWLGFLTPERQYGLTLALIFTLIQSGTYFISENVMFEQSMLGCKATNALIGLIYDKQFKISAATNKQFKQGELITFVQVDAEKMNLISFQFPVVASLPLMITVGFFLLFYYLGLSVITGVLIMLGSFYTNSLISRFNAKV